MQHRQGERVLGAARLAEAVAAGARFAPRAGAAQAQRMRSLSFLLLVLPAFGPLTGCISNEPTACGNSSLYDGGSTWVCQEVTEVTANDQFEFTAESPHGAR
jgi:hypothetical protein